jgi:hypothetical protein
MTDRESNSSYSSNDFYEDNRNQGYRSVTRTRGPRSSPDTVEAVEAVNTRKAANEQAEQDKNDEFIGGGRRGQGGRRRRDDRQHVNRKKQRGRLGGPETYGKGSKWKQTEGQQRTYTSKSQDEIDYERRCPVTRLIQSLTGQQMHDIMRTSFVDSFRMDMHLYSTATYVDGESMYWNEKTHSAVAQGKKSSQSSVKKFPILMSNQWIHTINCVYQMVLSGAMPRPEMMCAIWIWRAIAGGLKLDGVPYAQHTYFLCKTIENLVFYAAAYTFNVDYYLYYYLYKEMTRTWNNAVSSKTSLNLKAILGRCKGKNGVQHIQSFEKAKYALFEEMVPVEIRDYELDSEMVLDIIEYEPIFSIMLQAEFHSGISYVKKTNLHDFEAVSLSDDTFGFVRSMMYWPGVLSIQEVRQRGPPDGPFSMKNQSFIPGGKENKKQFSHTKSSAIDYIFQEIEGELCILSYSNADLFIPSYCHIEVHQECISVDTFCDIPDQRHKGDVSVIRSEPFFILRKRDEKGNAETEIMDYEAVKGILNKRRITIENGRMHWYEQYTKPERIQFVCEEENEYEPRLILEGKTVAPKFKEEKDGTRTEIKPKFNGMLGFVVLDIVYNRHRFGLEFCSPEVDILLKYEYEFVVNRPCIVGGGKIFVEKGKSFSIGANSGSGMGLLRVTADGKREDIMLARKPRLLTKEPTGVYKGTSPRYIDDYVEWSEIEKRSDDHTNVSLTKSTPSVMAHVQGVLPIGTWASDEETIADVFRED